MIRSKLFAIACAMSTGLLWSICSALVVCFPNYMLQMTAHMFHVDLADVHWTMTWSGFLLGLLGWTLLAGSAGALLAVVYNRLLGSEAH